MATLELTLHYPLPLRWQRHIHVSNQCKGERPPLQRPVVLTIVTSVSKRRVPMRSTGLVQQPIELSSGLTYSSIYPIALPLMATLELTLQYTTNRGKNGRSTVLVKNFKNLTANPISINSLLLHCAEAEPISASLRPGKHLFLKKYRSSS